MAEQQLEEVQERLKEAEERLRSAQSKLDATNQETSDSSDATRAAEGGQADSQALEDAKEEITVLKKKYERVRTTARRPPSFVPLVGCCCWWWWCSPSYHHRHKPRPSRAKRKSTRRASRAATRNSRLCANKPRSTSKPRTTRLTDSRPSLQRPRRLLERLLLLMYVSRVPQLSPSAFVHSFIRSFVRLAIGNGGERRRGVAQVRVLANPGDRQAAGGGGEQHANATPRSQQRVRRRGWRA